MKKIQRTALIFAVALAAMSLQGCLTSVVTAPVKIVYGAGKLAVKGTAAAVRAVTPSSDDKKTDDDKTAKDDKQAPKDQQPTPQTTP